MTKHKQDSSEDKLTVKQKKFVDEYIRLGNKKQAAINAGYSTKYPDRQANQTLQLDYVQAYYKQQMNKLHAKNIASAEQVLMFLTKMMNGEINEETVAPNSTVVTLRANNSERLSAAKELLKRYPTDMIRTQIKKLEAETKLTDAKTKMLTQTDSDADDALANILDKIEDKANGKDDDGK